jgi:hypothetical protein
MCLIFVRHKSNEALAKAARFRATMEKVDRPEKVFTTKAKF